MTPIERRRAGRSVAERMRELNLTAPQLAQQAQVSPRTIRRLLSGDRSLRDETLDCIAAALRWPPGEIARRAIGDGLALTEISTVDLARELCRRLTGHGTLELDTPGP